MNAPAAAPWPGPAHHLLTQAIGYADGVLDAVTPRLLSQPTPCRDWDLRMLLEHAEASLGTLLEGVTACRVAVIPGQVPARDHGDSTAAALVGAFRRDAAALAHASAQAHGDAPVTIGGYPIPLDGLRAAGALEIAVHAWDISQACGQRLPIPDGLAADLLAQALLLVPLSGRHPLFAAPVPVPSRPAPSDRLTAYLGRPAYPGLAAEGAALA